MDYVYLLKNLTLAFLFFKIHHYVMKLLPLQVNSLLFLCFVLFQPTRTENKGCALTWAYILKDGINHFHVPFT